MRGKVSNYDYFYDLLHSYGQWMLPGFRQNGGQASKMNADFLQSYGKIVIFLGATC